MKCRGTLIHWVSVVMFTGSGLTAFGQTTTPAETRAPAATTEDQEATRAIENLLKFYKSYLNSVNEKLVETDAQPVGQAKAQKVHDAPAAQASTINMKGNQGGLRSGHLELGHIQAGTLPLTLPDVPPTQRPAIEYEGTMFQRAIYDKALSDRYKFYHDQKPK